MTAPISGPKIAVSLRHGKTVTRFTCALAGTQAFANTPAGGSDETQTLRFSCPEGATLTPRLPWGHSTLLASAPPLHDAWKGVALDVTVAGTDYGTFTGTLDTTVGDTDPQRDKEARPRDEFDNFEWFRGGLRSALAGAGKARLWFVGLVHLGVKGQRITDTSGFWTEGIS